MAANERATTTGPVSDAAASNAAHRDPNTQRKAAAEVAGAVMPIDGLRGRVEALTVARIKDVYLGCSNEALRRRLDGGEAAMCSVAYDVLLKHHFGGDFDALLAWSRQQGGVGDESQTDGPAKRPGG